MNSVIQRQIHHQPVIILILPLTRRRLSVWRNFYNSSKGMASTFSVYQVYILIHRSHR
ncbi:hypothetical protein IH785_16535 [candidate division KSB1 bacterium]|nr:hypothetical protein [candidate division KSB1 bacterium]